MPTQNHRLTAVLANSEISYAKPQASGMVITMTDGRTATISATPQRDALASTWAKAIIKTVQEDSATLHIVTGSGTLSFSLTNPGNSVIVRSSSGSLLYAG